MRTSARRKRTSSATGGPTLPAALRRLPSASYWLPQASRRLPRASRRLLALVLVLTLAAAGCGKKAPSTDYEDVEGDTWVDYTVAPSQSWASIAEDFFGDSGNAARIAADNGAELSEPPDPGQTLRIRIRHDELDQVRRLARAREPYNAGVAALAAGRYEEAREDFLEALRLAPEFVDARYNLGLSLLKLGRPDEAIEPLRQVAADRPMDKDAAYALASAWFHLGRYGEAVDGLERALELDPGFLRAQYTLALALERMGEGARARQAWQRYLELDATSAWADEARQHLKTLP